MPAGFRDAAFDGRRVTVRCVIGLAGSCRIAAGGQFQGRSNLATLLHRVKIGSRGRSRFGGGVGRLAIGRSLGGFAFWRRVIRRFQRRGTDDLDQCMASREQKSSQHEDVAGQISRARQQRLGGGDRLAQPPAVGRGRDGETAGCDRHRRDGRTAFANFDEQSQAQQHEHDGHSGRPHDSIAEPTELGGATQQSVDDGRSAAGFDHAGRQAGGGHQNPDAVPAVVVVDAMPAQRIDEQRRQAGHQ